MILHNLVAFKDKECTRHVCKGDQEIIEHLLYQDCVVFRPDTNQTAVMVLEGCVAWVDIANSPKPFQDNSQYRTISDRKGL